MRHTQTIVPSPPGHVTQPPRYSTKKLQNLAKFCAPPLGHHMLYHTNTQVSSPPLPGLTRLTPLGASLRALRASYLTTYAALYIVAAGSPTRLPHRIIG